VVHSLSTSVISPDGTIYKWYSGNEWKPADLLDDAAKALATAKAAPKTSPAVRGS
jgi:protein SCO1/2